MAIASKDLIALRKLLDVRSKMESQPSIPDATSAIVLLVEGGMQQEAASLFESIEEPNAMAMR